MSCKTRINLSVLSKQMFCSGAKKRRMSDNIHLYLNCVEQALDGGQHKFTPPPFPPLGEEAVGKQDPHTLSLQPPLPLGQRVPEEVGVLPAVFVAAVDPNFRILLRPICLNSWRPIDVFF